MTKSLSPFRRACAALALACIGFAAVAQVNFLDPNAHAPAPPQPSETPQTAAETSYNPPALGGGTVATDLSGVDINEKVDGGTLRGQLRFPMEPTLGIVLIPDWWGLTKSAQDESGYWGVEGGRVMTVDLLEGKIPANRGEATRLNKALDPAATLKVLHAAFDLAAWGQDDWQGDHHGKKPLPTVIIGYGTGADLALRLAAQEGNRAAALAIYYGGITSDEALAAKLKAPVVGIFAENDPWVSPERVDKFKNLLLAHKVPNHFSSYATRSGFALNNKNLDDKTFIEQARDAVWQQFNQVIPPSAAKSPTPKP